MVFKIVIPQLGKKPSVKDAIMTVLSTDWPLKIKSLHNKIKTTYNLDVSYQAIHKSLKELSDDDVLIQIDDGWQLNQDWITQSFNFFHSLKDQYRDNPLLKAINMQKGITTMNFTSLGELDDFYFNLFNYIPTGTKKIIFHFRHNWKPLIYPQKEYKYLKKDKQYYFLYSGETTLDKWCEKFYKNLKIKIRYEKNCADVCEVYIIDDIVIQVYFPKELIENLNLAFSSVKDVKSLDLNYFIKNLINKKFKILAVITKNNEIADKIKDYTLSLFK